MSALSKVSARIDAITARIRRKRPQNESQTVIRNSVVYLIGFGNLVKIGWAVDPEARVRKVGVNRRNYESARRSGAVSDEPFKRRDMPVLIGIVPGDRVEETRLHKLFAPHRAKLNSGFFEAPYEWFEWCPGLRELEKIGALTLARYRSGGDWKRLAFSLGYRVGFWRPAK